MAITADQMKFNLQQARRSSRVEMSEPDKAIIRKLVKGGISKKAVVTLFGITYQELKNL